MININKNLLTDVVEKANSSPRNRMNYNFHKESSDPLQRMLNAINPGSYVHPHKHDSPDKREAFIILQGKMAVVLFDDKGNITEYSILNREIGNHGIEIPPKKWHTIISLEENSVVYEVKDGPYERMDDKNFAAWAPKENSPEATEYLDHLIKRLGLS